MSASREKQQRQGSGTVNNAAARSQTDAAKRKTIQYTIIGVVTAVLVAALLIWDAGFIQRGTTAATVGHTDYSVGELNYYYYNVYQNTAMYAQYGLNTYDTSTAPEDQVYSTDTETGEVTTYADYFRQSALEQLVSVTAAYEAAIADGYTEADVKDSVEDEIDSLTSTAKSNGYTSLKQMLIAYYGKMVTPTVFRNILTTQFIAEKYLTDYEEALDFTESDLQSYYQENADSLDTFAYSYWYYKAASVETTDADGNDLSDEDIAAAEAEALTAAEATANELADLLKDGADITDFIAENEPTNSYEDNITLGSSLTAAVSEWLTDSSRQSGDVGVVNYNDYGYYVVSFSDRYLDETPSVDVRHILIKADMDEDVEEPTEEQMAAAKAEAEDLLAQWQNGEATEDSFAALANEYSDDTGSNTNGGLYEGVFPGDFVTGFNNWLFNEGTRNTGDTNIIENAGTSNYYGYHVTYFVNNNPDDFKWKETVRNTLTNEAVTTFQEDLEANITTTEQSGMKYVG